MDINIKDIPLHGEELRSFGSNQPQHLNMPVLDLAIYEFYLANPNQKYFYTVYTNKDFTSIDSDYDIFKNFGFNVLKPRYEDRDFILSLNSLQDNNDALLLDIASFILTYLPKGFYPNKLYIRDAIYYSEEDRLIDVTTVRRIMKESFPYLDVIYYLNSIGEFNLDDSLNFEDIRASITISLDRISIILNNIKEYSDKFVTSYRTVIPSISNDIKYKTIFDSEKINFIFKDIKDSFLGKSLESYSNCFQFQQLVKPDGSRSLGRTIASVFEYNIDDAIDKLYSFEVKKSLSSLELFDSVTSDENIYSNIIPVYKRICEDLYNDINIKLREHPNSKNVRVVLSSSKVLESKLRSSFFSIVTGMKVMYDIDAIIPRDFVGLYTKYINRFFISKYGMLLEDKLDYLKNIPPVMLNVSTKSINLVFKNSSNCNMLLTLFDIKELDSYSKLKLIPIPGEDIKIDLDTLHDTFKLVSIKDTYNLESADLSALMEGHNKIKSLLLAARDCLVESTSGRDSDYYYTNPPTILNSIILKNEKSTYLAVCKKLDFNYNGKVQNLSVVYKSLDAVVFKLLTSKGINVPAPAQDINSNLENDRCAFIYNTSFSLDDLYKGILMDLNILYERRAVASICFMNGTTKPDLYSKEVMSYLTKLSLGVKPYRSNSPTLDAVGIYMLSRVRTSKVLNNNDTVTTFENISTISASNYLASALYSNIVSIYRSTIKPCYDRTFINLADFRFFDITNSPTYNIVSTEEDGLIRSSVSQGIKFSSPLSIKNRIRLGKEGILYSNFK